MLEMCVKMMFLSIKKAYFAMYYLFEYYYFNVDQLDDLGAILDPISPFLFDGGMPADQAKWSDWIDVLKKNEVTEFEGDCIEDAKAFEAALMFILSHYEEYKFDVRPAVDYFAYNRSGNVKVLWEDAIRKALSTDDSFLENV